MRECFVLRYDDEFERAAISPLNYKAVLGGMISCNKTVNFLLFQSQGALSAFVRNREQFVTFEQ